MAILTTTRRRAIESRGSTGVTGFALTAMCIGAERSWISRENAKDHVRHTLRSYTNGKVPPEHGWFYHFIDVHTGERWKEVEISTSDCIWLLAGALTCRQYFHEDHEIGDLATLLYSRYDFPWMTNGDGKLLSHGWKPEGFLKPATRSIASLRPCICWASARPRIRCRPTPGTPGSAIPTPTAATTTSARRCFGPISIRLRGSIFAAGARHAGGKVDWFENCQIATRAHREWCYTDLAKQFPDYTQEPSGASPAPQAPRATRRGVVRPRTRKIDGTVVPCAAGGSLMLTPDICIPAMHAMKDKFGDKIWGKYGFADAFNPAHRLGFDRYDRAGCRHDPAQCGEPSQRQCLEVVHGQSGAAPAMKLAGIEKA